jgi:cytochrome c oxidase assembly factor CtaG
VIIFVVAGVITALSLQPTLAVLFWVVRIAFFIAIAFFIYRLWRQRRGQIAAWPTRAKIVFYGGAVLAVVNLVLSAVTDYPSGGLEILVFIAVLVAAGFSMWRIWVEQHSYGY